VREFGRAATLRATSEHLDHLAAGLNLLGDIGGALKCATSSLSLDPRNWSVLVAGDTTSEVRPIGVGIDILDEGHSLKLAIRRLAADDKLRAMLGSNTRALWAERFQLEGMVAGYRRVVAQLLQAATERPGGLEELPLHLRSGGAEYADSLVREIAGPEYHLRDAD